MNRNHRTWSRLAADSLAWMSPVFLLPLILYLLPPYTEEQPQAFLLPGILFLLPLGFKSAAAWIQKKRRPRTAPRRESGPNEKEAVLFYLACLLLASLAGIIPYTELTPLNPVEGLFESLSGWTTTGLSRLDPASLPPSLLLFRSLSQFAGALAAILLFSSLSNLPLGTGTLHEGTREFTWPEPFPLMKKQLPSLLKLFLPAAAGGTGYFILCGLPPLASLNHTLTSLSTGGFSPHARDLGYWDIPGVKGATLVLMLLGGFSLLLGSGLIRRLRRDILTDTAVRGTLLYTGFLVYLITAVRSSGFFGKEFLQALPEAFFLAVSTITTTGFTGSSTHLLSADSQILPVIVLATAAGGGLGTAAGGFKLFRLQIIFQNLGHLWKKHSQPLDLVPAKTICLRGGAWSPSDAILIRIFLVVFSYLTVLMLGTLLCLLAGNTPAEAILTFSSSLSNSAIASAEFPQDMPMPLLAIHMTGMVFGRLEAAGMFIALAYLLNPRRLWRERRV